ncbi:hypothetical protein ABZX38_21245 [Streptomyces longwoodensis]
MSAPPAPPALTADAFTEGVLLARWAANRPRHSRVYRHWQQLPNRPGRTD